MPAVAASLFFAGLFAGPLPAQQQDPATVVQHIDAAVKARIDNVSGYSSTEHYAVFRNNDEVHAVAEMTVKAVYSRDTGKSYTPIAQSGSEIIRGTVLNSILDNERHMSQPGNREGAWITSANYDMKLQPEHTQLPDGRDCLVVALTPRRTAPYLFTGTLWVDAKDYSIVQFQGTATKSPTVLAGPAQVARQYATVSGFPMATHARAVSSSFLFGPTIIKIDYLDYQVELKPAP